MCFWFLAYVDDLYFTSTININQWAATIFPFSYNYNETVNNAVNGTISFISDGATIANQGIADDSRVLNNDGLIEVNLPSASDQASILIKLI